MDIAQSWNDKVLQPQIFSMMFLTFVLCVLAIFIYIKASKQKVEEAPKGVLLYAEQYVIGVENLVKDVSNGELKKPTPYIFSLITILLFGNLLGLLGLEPITSSYSVTLTLALVTWIGTYVIGIAYSKIMYFKKYLINPMDAFSDLSPLISLSMRIFGNITGGSTLLYIVYYATGALWGKIPVIGQVNLLGSLIAMPLHAYFDIFGGLIQAYVFTLLTTVYWSLETEEGISQRKSRVYKKEQRKIKKQTKLLRS